MALMVYRQGESMSQVVMQMPPIHVLCVCVTCGCADAHTAAKENPQNQAIVQSRHRLACLCMQCSILDEVDAIVQVLKDVLKLARRHEVGIDSSYAALVLGVCGIVGFATSLDYRINIMDAATPCFLQHSLTGKASGRLY